MAIVKYQKIAETEKQVRYSFSPVPDETYYLEYDKIHETLAPSREQVRGLAQGVLADVIRQAMKQDPQARSITQWPQSGQFRT